MKFNPRTIVALATIAFAGVTASAQRMPSSPYLTVSQRSAFLLANPYEARKIDLSSTQVQAFKKILAAYSAKQSKLLKVKEPSEKDMQANDKVYATGCLKILTPVQADKLLAIGVQEIGTDALKDSTICAKIGLGSGQVHKIVAISDGYSKHVEDVEAMVGAAMEKVPEPKAGGDRKEYDKKQLEVYNSYEGERMRLQREKLEADKSIVAIMTADQRDKWVALVGKPDQKSPDKSSKN